MLSHPFELERSIKIEKPVADVYACVSDFHSWIDWSPWLCQEPETQTHIEGEAGQKGHTQTWIGQRIGEGKNTLVSFEINKSLIYDLHSIKPWKSHSKVSFFLEEHEGGTLVRWGMKGSVPIFLFFLRKMMSLFVGGDYERGLAMLKEYIEKGDVPTRVEFKGDAEQGPFRYMGLRRECSISEMATFIESDFAKMRTLAAKGELTRPDFAITFYHKWDLVEKRCEYTSAYAYRKTIQDMAPKGFTEGRVDTHKALQVNHFGAYRYLGNAWATLMGAQRSFKKRSLKNIPIYEIYRNLDSEIPEKEKITELYLPIKN